MYTYVYTYVYIDMNSQNFTKVDVCNESFIHKQFVIKYSNDFCNLY